MNGGDKDWENNPYIDLAKKAYNDLSSSFKLAHMVLGRVLQLAI